IVDREPIITDRSRLWTLEGECLSIDTQLTIRRLKGVLVRSDVRQNHTRLGLEHELLVFGVIAVHTVRYSHIPVAFCFRLGIYIEEVWYRTTFQSPIHLPNKHGC